MIRDYTRFGDLEVEGKLQLDDECLSECVVRTPEAAFTPECTPSPEEFRACVELVNELRDKLNALIGVLT